MQNNWQEHPARILNIQNDDADAVVRLRRWSEREAFWRGGKKALKIVGFVFLAALPLAVIEPFLFLIWGTVLISGLIFFVGPYLHLKYWNEKISFDFVEGVCASCHQKTRLAPYLSTEVKTEFTVLCPLCGQTSRVSTSL